LSNNAILFREPTHFSKAQSAFMSVLQYIWPAVAYIKKATIAPDFGMWENRCTSSNVVYLSSVIIPEKMDPISITFGTIGAAGVGGQVVQSSREFRSNYRNAAEQISHAQSQLEILRSTLNEPALKLNAKCSKAQYSFKTISENFPNELRSNSKKARFLWAWKHKGHVSELISQLKETEVSTTLALQLEHGYVVNSRCCMPYLTACNDFVATRSIISNPLF